ncbi:MAG TPA: glutamate racemase [Steroidobacteraceae bacterium]
MSEAPIGVFDSGVGGLSVLQALLTELPQERFIYLGDTARLPYGTKSATTVARYASQAAEALAEYGLKCLVVACNTAAASSLPAIRARLEGVPVIGVIEPGAQAACEASLSGHIGVIATEGTVSGRAYEEAILRRRRDARVSALATQLFVALAEEGVCSGPIAQAVAHHYLAALCTAGADAPDTLVLGCTHFPLLMGAIRGALGEHIRIVDSAATSAREVRGLLDAAGLRRRSAPIAARFLATDGAARFARIGSLFLGRTIAPADVELIDL